MQHPDRPLLGIVLVLGFSILAPLGDAMAKILGAALPLAFTVFVRFIIQGAVLWPLASGRIPPPAVAPKLWAWALLRTVLHAAAIAAMYMSLRYLPLADAVAIAFVMPFILLLLGHVFLGEEIGPHRIGAVIVGFIGALMVIQPNFARVGVAALLPVIVALAFALFMLVTRRISRQIDPVPLQALGGIMGAALLAPLSAIWVWQSPGALVAAPTWVWPLLLAMGLLGTVAHLLMTWSLRFAPAATLAPVQYMEIPFSAAIGLVLFSDLPNGLALAGIVISVAAGLYIIGRERAMSRAGLLPPT